MATQVTLYEFSDEMKQRLKEKKFLGTPEEIEIAKQDRIDAITTNRKLGQKIRWEKVKAKDTKLSVSVREEARKKSIDLVREKKDTLQLKNRVAMMEGEPFYIEIDNRFPVHLWGKDRSKYRISSKTFKTQPSERIEKLMIGRMKRGLDQSIAIEERPKVEEALENFKTTVDDYIKAIEEGRRPKEIITAEIDVEDLEVDLFITGS